MKDVVMENLESYAETNREEALGTDDAAEKEAAHRRYMESMTLLRETEHDWMEYEDKEARRELEEKKNSDAKEVELKKQKMSISRILLEVAKIAIPTGIAAALTIRAQDHSEYMETHGQTCVTKSSRIADGLRPNVWSFLRF